MLLSLNRLTEILDRPQTTHGRIEECQQVGHEHVVKEQPPIAVLLFAPQLPNLLLQQPDILSTQDRYRPHSRRLCRMLIDGHNDRRTTNLPIAKFQNTLRFFRTVMGSASALREKPPPRAMLQTAQHQLAAILN